MSGNLYNVSKGGASEQRTLSETQVKHLLSLGKGYEITPVETAAPPLRTMGGSRPAQAATPENIATEEAGESMLDSLKRSGKAFVRGAGNPIGAADEIQAFAETVGTDRDYETARQEAEREERGIAEQNPAAYGTGRAVTTAAALAPTAAAAPASIAGKVALGAAEGGAVGAATGAAESQPGMRQEGAIEGGLAGAKWGAGLGLGLASLAKSAGWLKKQADQMRGSAPGMYSGQAAAIAKDKGKDYIGEIGEAIEKWGGDKRGGIASPMPMGAAAYAKRLEEVVDKVGREMGGILEEATTAGVSVPANKIRNRIVERAVQLEGKATDSARAQADKLYEIAGYIDEGPEVYTARELQALKQDWTEEVWKSGDVAKPRGGNTAEAYRASAGVPREMLDEAIESGMSAEKAARFKELRGDYGKLRTAQDMAEGRELRETGNQLLSLPTTVMGAGGMATRDPAIALASMAGQAATKKYGKDMAADVLRGAQKVGEAAGHASPATGVAGASAARSARPQSAVEMVQQLAENNPDQLGEFAYQLSDAARRGPTDFHVTHATLAQTDPKYQRLLRDLEERESED